MEKNKLRLQSISQICIQLILMFVFLFPLYSAPRDVIVIFRGYDSSEDRLYSGIKKELASQYELFDMIITSDSKWKEFDFAIRRWNPKMVIATGPLPIRQFAEYSKKLADKSLVVPSLLLANPQTLLFHPLIPGSTAIVLDVPISTSMLSLQAVFRSRLKHPGIIHTRLFDNIIEIEKALLNKHSITLSNVSINGRTSELPAQIQESITWLLDTAQIDCLILPDDPVLFRKEFLPIWQSCLNHLDIPVIGNRSAPDLDSMGIIACTFFPDTSAAISQISRKIEQIKKDGWKINNTIKEYIVSIKKAADLKVIEHIPNISSDLFKTFDIMRE